jgi:carboxylesterase
MPGPLDRIGRESGTLLDPLAAPFCLDGSIGEGVLVVHGFGGTPAHLRLLGEHLNAHGYTVLGPLLEGHGTSLEHMDTTGRLDWLDSARKGYQELSETCRRVHLFGLSMGGLLSLSLAARLPAASLTTLNTPMKLRDRRQPLARVLQYVDRFRKWDADGPEPEGEAARYWVQYKGFSVKAAVQLLDLIRATKSVLPQVTAPLLVIQSRVDESVRPVSAEIITKTTSSFRKELIWLERSLHNSLLYDERNIIHQEVLEHIRSS